MSMRIRLGCSSRASVSPASASLALITVCPADCNRNVASVMLAGLSSTTSTLAMSGNHLAAGHGSPNFVDEAIAVEVGLFHDRQHVAIESITVLGRDVLGGEIGRASW